MQILMKMRERDNNGGEGKEEITILVRERG